MWKRCNKTNVYFLSYLDLLPHVDNQDLEIRNAIRVITNFFRNLLKTTETIIPLLFLPICFLPSTNPIYVAVNDIRHIEERYTPAACVAFLVVFGFLTFMGALFLFSVETICILISGYGVGCLYLWTLVIIPPDRELWGNTRNQVRHGIIRNKEPVVSWGKVRNRMVKKLPRKLGSGGKLQNPRAIKNPSCKTRLPFPLNLYIYKCLRILSIIHSEIAHDFVSTCLHHFYCVAASTIALYFLVVGFSNDFATSHSLLLRSLCITLLILCVVVEWFTVSFVSKGSSASRLFLQRMYKLYGRRKYERKVLRSQTPNSVNLEFMGSVETIRDGIQAKYFLNYLSRVSEITVSLLLGL